MIELDQLVDVAPRGTATQSSLSQWSLPTGAQALIQSIHQDFLIHTNFETNPWWQVDLKMPFPVHRIIIGNRREPKYWDRASSLEVRTSVDGKNWQLIHAGLMHFGDMLRAPGMVLELDDKLYARYVQLSLSGFQALHLSSIQILVRKKGVIKAEFWHQHKLISPALSEDQNNAKNFDIVSVGSPNNMQISGLKIRAFGRMGNNIMQTINALHLASHVSIRTVCAPKIAFGSSNYDVSDGQISLIAAESPLPDGLYLESDFFFIHQPSVYKTLTPQLKSTLAEKFILPLMGLRACASVTSAQFERELAVHIRAGDIFSADPHPEYVQPPLSFYKHVVEELLSQNLISSVCVVTEDRGNPCIDALEEWLAAKHIPSRTQSGTLVEDVEYLRRSAHVVYGYGTFGYGVSILAGQIKTLHSFGMRDLLIGLPNVQNLYVYDAKHGSYIERGNWRNSPEQREMMLNFPAHSMEKLT